MLTLKSEKKKEVSNLRSHGYKMVLLGCEARQVRLPKPCSQTTHRVVNPRGDRVLFTKAMCTGERTTSDLHTLPVPISMELYFKNGKVTPPLLSVHQILSRKHVFGLGVCPWQFPTTIWGWNCAESPDSSLNSGTLTRVSQFLQKSWLWWKMFFLFVFDLFCMVFGPRVCKFRTFAVQQAVSDGSFNKTRHPSLLLK